MQVDLTEPSGAYHRQFDLEWLRAKVFQPRKGFWEIGGEANRETVEVDCFGEKTLFYGKYLIPPPTTSEIVEHFLQTGRKFPRIK